ncbi:predicted protein [Nematostella vectensis]|uniref:Uncharacterized protein n=1 Tax=Nematostella vectensis TaxID=45351 RepID=A7RNS9_NEMVE|nr:uncharacterized protein LOC5519124 [Nematostella vectensis]EDO46904.1 predicted protein [Nematostella vectensis]|eukprot:XP_001638967.1 predicted protein [Nematostella vectensis]
MKTLIVICMLAAVASATYSYRERRAFFEKCSSEADCGEGRCCLLNKRCFPKLPKYSICMFEEKHGCGCQEGLECKVTKTISIKDQPVFTVRQCMPVDEEVTVENLGDNDVDASIRDRRGLLGRCSKDEDCTGWNQCCLFGKRCGLKIGKYFTCYFMNKHKCGCMDGLECRQTTSITLPIVQVPFAIKQCVPKEDVPAEM